VAIPGAMPALATTPSRRARRDHGDPCSSLRLFGQRA
jgi:hypothetical protein